MGLGPRREVVDRVRVDEGLVDRELEHIVEHFREEPPTDGRAELETGVDVALD